ncbi:MAG TPA: hypothetical protein VGE18_03240 [Candidatus Paceibacterota bacterium]
MKIYTESSTGNKRQALKNALRGFGWELQNTEFSLDETASLITIEETIKGSIRRAQRLTIEDIIPDGSLVIGIQKGWSVKKDVALLLAVSGFIKGALARPITECAEISLNAPKMAEAILSGMHPYDAYEKVKGISIRKNPTPVYEIITGKSETVWMEGIIRKVLTAFQTEKAIH